MEQAAPFPRPTIECALADSIISSPSLPLLRAYLRMISRSQEREPAMAFARCGRVLFAGIGLLIVTAVVLATRSDTAFAQPPAKGSAFTKFTEAKASSSSAGSSSSEKDVKAYYLNSVGLYDKTRYKV